MSELRQDPTSREWVIIAPERGDRPTQRPKKRAGKEVPDWDGACPFCPGNEGQTPDEIFRLPPSGEPSDWAVRVIPNRFAALRLTGDVNREEDGHLFRKMNGFGLHEVIIETPSHNTPMALMAYQQVEMVLIAYHKRYNILKENHQLKYITIFKNHGWASGTSLEHPHSQLIASPIAATYYRRKFEVAVNYYDDVGRCLYCDLLTEELQKEERIVAVTKEFVVLHPYAPSVPWETWIIPKRHLASFGLLPTTHIAELGIVLKDTLLSLYRGLDNPAFNYLFDTSTTEDEQDPHYHWHIRIVPRVTTIAGFEMGSGMHITTALPEQTASLMKQAAPSGSFCGK